MNSFLRSSISKLFSAVSAPVAATRDALAERLQSVRDTASLYNSGQGRRRRSQGAMARTNSSQRTTTG